MNDNVNNPKHYTSHPSGVECIEIAEILPFNLGNALKYLWRAGKKLDEVEDIKKETAFQSYYLGHIDMFATIH